MAPPFHSFQYQTRLAQRVDLAVHLVGLTLAGVGGVIIVALGAGVGAAVAAAMVIYAFGIIAMLSLSLLYNFSGEHRRDLLRRLDHSGIFLMIAGSYTPFTTLALKGAWAWWMTLAVWSVAVLGVLGKLFVPWLREGVWVALYLTMGWMIVIAIVPIAEALPRPALMLLVLGGLLYSVGVVFHIKEDMLFSRSLWHGHVVAGAAAHWGAVLLGTVLPAVQAS